MTSQSINSPDRKPLQGLARLMSDACAGADLARRGAALIERATRDDGDANALLDLSIVLQLIGQRDVGLATQSQALAVRQLYSLPVAGERTIRVLALMTRGDLSTNAPLEVLAEHADVSLDLLFLGPDLPFPEALPEHDVLYVAINESDDTRALLRDLQPVLSMWPRPVVNQPERILALSRDEACVRLAGVPGLVMPPVVRASRASLEQVARGERAIDSLLSDLTFPIILRPVGSHAGRGLVKCEDRGAIGPYLTELLDAEFYLSRFVDYSGTDGQFRKYRVVLIEGRPFICHMAVSSHWMVHYLNAGMNEDAGKRAEEAQAMASFDGDFARVHASALEAIAERFGLEYVGIDCAVTRDGQLLVFELDSGPIVHALDPVDLFPYKQEPMRRLFEAFRAMLERAVTKGEARAE